jgi:glycogen phosphorylase
MSFQIHPVREILVVPALPPALGRLPELGLNLLWSWNHSMRAVFRRLDPVAWKASRARTRRGRSALPRPLSPRL